MPQFETCLECNGKGYIEQDEEKQCDLCLGVGLLIPMPMKINPYAPTDWFKEISNILKRG